MVSKRIVVADSSRPRPIPGRLLLLALMAVTASCGGEGAMPPGPPPPPPPPPPVAPVQVGTIPDQAVATGQTATLDVVSYFRDPDGGALTYTAASSAAGVVSVSLSGSTLTMVGVADGTATVTVTARDPDGLTAAQSFGVTVETPNRAPEEVGTIPNQTVETGRTITLTVSSYFRDPDGDALTFAVASSAAGVVSVSLSGSTLTLVGVAAGAATVTVTARDPAGLTAAQSFEVTVAPPVPSSVTVRPETVSLTAVGDAVRLSAEVRDAAGRPIPGAAVAWTSSDPSVASVDVSGLVTAAGNGAATVTATAGSASGSAAVTVTQRAAAVRVSPAEGTLEALGETLRLTAEAFDANGHGIAGAAFAWMSSDATVAAVDGTGLVTAVGNGSATVTAASGGVSASAAVTVSQSEAAVRVYPTEGTLAALGDTLRLAAEALDANGNGIAGAAFAWMSSDPTVATVDGTGLVTAAGDGSTTVTAVAGSSGVSGSATIVVEAGSFRDDFDSPASAERWKTSHNADVTVGEGVLSVTNRTAGRLGIAERAPTPTVNDWTIQARMGRKTRKAGPGVVSLTGHSRFTAVRLVLRTLDDSSPDRRSDGAADAARTSGNYEFAVFDRETREWVRITEMSGGSDAVNESAGEFTDIRLGHEGGDFVAYAGVGGSAELFRVDVDDARLDGVVLREVVEHVTGFWLVNQSAPGLTAVHDWVEVTGTESMAAAPDGGEIVDASDAATRSEDVTNRAPVAVGTIPAQTVETDESETLDVSSYFRDPDGDALTYAASSSASAVVSVSMSGSTLTLAGTAAGGATVTVTATDPGGLAATQSFRVAVETPNRAPVAVGTIPARTVEEDESETLDVSSYFRDPDGDALTYTASSSASAVVSVSVSGSTLAMSGVAAGGATVTVTATDPDGLTATQSFGVTVETPNRAPVAVGTIPARTVEEDESETLDVSSYFRDPDGDALTYTASSSASAVVSVSVSGSTLAMSGVAAGSATVTVTATDPDGLTATQSFGVTVEDGEGSDTCTVGQVLSPGDSCTYSGGTFEVLNNGCVRLSGLGSGSLCARNVNYNGFQASRQSGNTWRIDAVPGGGGGGNQAPVAVGTIPARTVEEDESETLDVSSYFRDPDGDALTYTASSSASAVVSVSMSGSTLTVTGVAAGDADVTVTARDPDGLSARQSFAVTVGDDQPAVTAAITQCSGRLIVPGIANVTIGGTITARVRVRSVSVETRGNGQVVGSRFIGNLSAGQSASFLTFGTISVSGTSLSCTANITWTNASISMDEALRLSVDAAPASATLDPR